MKIMKLSSILLLSMFFMLALIPEASARHCHKKCRSSFGLSFNVGGPRYVVAPAPVVAASAPVVVPAPVYPAPVYAYPAYAAPGYPYPYYGAPVVIERSAPRAYVQPGFSYSYWRY